ncbi:MAG: Fic family protein, partial [Spirochaetes bacterium]|nr:Fic family protein [Spirochaetota bacterium]
YDNLTNVRTKNDLGQWIKFFLTGIIQTSEKAVTTLKSIVDLKLEIEEKKMPELGKRSKYGRILFLSLFSKPVLNVKDVQDITGLSPKAAYSLVESFINNGILKETTGYQRNRVFIFEEYVKMFR